MRAFFVSFFVSAWVLCAQGNPEIPTFERLKADYDLMKKEIADAKDRIVAVEFKWVEDRSKHLQKMLVIREWIIEFSSLDERKAASNINLEPLKNDLVFVGKRLIVEGNIKEWTLDDIKPEMTLLSQELNRFEQSGFMGPHELYRPSKILWDLSIIEQTLASSEFVSRVCKDVEGCADEITALLKKVLADQARAKIWMEKANRQSSVPPPMPIPQSKRPG